MATGWGIVGIVYILSNLLQKQGIILTPSIIDNLITFNTMAIWGYLSFFILIPFSYLYCPLSRLLWLTRSMQLTALCCGAFYLFFPTTLQYPNYADISISGKFLALLIDYDSAQNCLPSLHAALSLLAVVALIQMDNKKGIFNLFLIIWVAEIYFSILQLKRHLFIDIAVGVLIAILCGLLCFSYYKKNRGLKLKEVAQ